MPGRSMPGLVGTGTKRKRDDGEDGLEGTHRLATCSQVCSYTLQRQCVLNLSACKLQMSRQQIEPPLRRSVLICNTLRHIERELRAEGRHYDCSRVSMLISNQPLCMDSPNKESIPSNHESSNSPSPADSRGCLNERGRASSENGSCPAVQRCAQPPTDKPSLSLSDSRLQADSVETAKTEISHENNNCLPSIANKANMPSHLDTAPQSTNITGALTKLTDKLLPISRDSSKHEINSCLDMTTTITTTATMTPTLNAASTDIMEFGDEIFGDIDVSLYDFDLASPFIPTTHTPNANPKPPPPSSTPEDWIRSFQGDMTGLDVPSPGAQGNCRSDLIHVDELDQIMHILVDVGM